jgi:hypothetical protein
MEGTLKMEKTIHNSSKIKEAWTGPGRKDGTIKHISPKDDAIHIDMKKKGSSEWWYFDASLENGYIVVGFFWAKHQLTGKTCIEITIYKPGGEKINKTLNYLNSDFRYSLDSADLQIGKNYIKTDYSNKDLPIYEVFLDEGSYGFHLKFTALVHGWMPGHGYTEFEGLGQFGWCIALPRALVEGIIKVNDEIIPVKGRGYHDHNWLSFIPAKLVEYWYWGRLYSENFTFCYAYIKCNKKMDNYPIQVLMLAKNEKIILSTGEYDLIQENFQYDNKAANNYPKSLIFKIPNQLETSLEVQKIIDSGNMLELFGINAIIRFIVKHILRLSPGYFRFDSKFIMKVSLEGKSYQEQGNTLHEMVILS